MKKILFITMILLSSVCISSNAGGVIKLAKLGGKMIIKSEKYISKEFQGALHAEAKVAGKDVCNIESKSNNYPFLLSKVFSLSLRKYADNKEKKYGYYRHSKRHCHFCKFRDKDFKLISPVKGNIRY